MKKIKLKNKVLITGSNGQLGMCIKMLENDSLESNLYFLHSKELDITNKENIKQCFIKNSFNYVINCAAYTNVEKAEKEPDRAFLVNAIGVKNLAEACKKYNSTLIHISTDYVFDGEKNSPYVEEDITNPINEYGRSKLKGEKYIQEILKNYYIIRTSWLYSQFGNNFYQTILKKSNEESKLTITSSEVGTPTNANDLAFFLLQIIRNRNENYGVYHFSNLGSVTWYDFAKEILRNLGKLESIKLKKTDNYPTFAQRPVYSVLSMSKLEKTFCFKSKNWDQSLKTIFEKTNNELS